MCPLWRLSPVAVAAPVAGTIQRPSPADRYMEDDSGTEEGQGRGCDPIVRAGLDPGNAPREGGQAVIQSSRHQGDQPQIDQAAGDQADGARRYSGEGPAPYADEEHGLLDADGVEHATEVGRRYRAARVAQSDVGALGGRYIDRPLWAHVSGGTVTPPTTIHMAANSTGWVLSPDVTVMTKKVTNTFGVELKVISPRQ
jgi:hypothetical protein